jgi:hypothetical protein
MFCVPTSLSSSIFPILPTNGLDVITFNLTRFHGVETNTRPRFFHESAKENKRTKLIFRVFTSPLLVDAEDMEVNPLHVIFDLKKVLVGKDYF